jgi:DNA-binding NtrC family response regulator
MTPPTSEYNKMKVLFIDDEADLWIGRFRTYLAKFDLQFIEELVAENALARIAAERPDVVLLDILFPGVDGQMEAKGPSALASICERFPGLPVVMITSTLVDAEYGIDEQNFLGARFLFSKDRFTTGSDGDPYAELAQQLLSAIKETGDQRSLDERMEFVVGTTSRMRRVAESVLQAAGTNSTVLICGESGTGKELVARALHRLSDRSEGALIAINCGVLTADVLESQLFGHERGAFTGALRDHRGFFEQADRGTLFLDEVDAMSPALQDKLLRVFDDRRIRRMGSQTEVSVDVRVIAATNKRLLELVDQGRFRQDLYYRLHVVQIELPPLRERLDDLPVLFSALVEKLNRRLGKNVATEARQDVLDMLRKFTWPGNIRQLEHALERAIVSARANVLTPSTIAGEAKSSHEAVPMYGLVSEILDGRAGWQKLKDLQGETRRAALEELIDGLTKRQGKSPTSSQLATLVGTSEGNMRRILSEAGVRLRRTNADG